MYTSLQFQHENHSPINFDYLHITASSKCYALTRRHTHIYPYTLCLTNVYAAQMGGMSGLQKMMQQVGAAGGELDTKPPKRKGRHK